MISNHDNNNEIKSCPNCGSSRFIVVSQTAIMNSIKCTSCGYNLGKNTSFTYIRSEWDRLSDSRKNFFKPPIIYYKKRKLLR